MKVINNIREMQLESDEIRADGVVIGFVPTMGALHKGHLSLVEIANEKSDVTVISIFVNPTQFGPEEDFSEYPRDLERDLQKCKENDVDIVFIPEQREMYPDGFSTYVEVEGLSEKLCGRSRPGHFKGVTTVVCKLLNIVKPHLVVFGQKDFQQAVIIRRMVEDLNIHTEMLVGPIIREEDGIAMSSRNQYLSEEERKSAVNINRALSLARDDIEDGATNPDMIKNDIMEFIKNNTEGRIDYVSIANPETLNEVSVIKDTVVVALAVYFGKTRLIDNILVEL